MWVLIDSIQNHAHYLDAILNGADFTISNHTALECSDKESPNQVVLSNISPTKVYDKYIPISGINGRWFSGVKKCEDLQH